MWANCPAGCGLTGGCNACRPTSYPHVPTAPQGVPIVPFDIPAPAFHMTGNLTVASDQPPDFAALLRERDQLAKRVDALWRQRGGLVRLLASIKRNGGCSERHWELIDGVLRAARRQTGRVTVGQSEKPKRRGQ